ncbi:MAG: LacI family DNA-binding transcriptional regulator [Aestuariivirga sp.]
MAITLKDVAKRAGVSESAVSRAFTQGASVSQKMRKKVEKVALELGYAPNALASSLTTGRTRLIGFVSNNFHNPFFLEVFDRFTKGLQAKGLKPLLVNLSDEPTPEGPLRMLKQYSVDGIIVASSTLPPSFDEAFSAAKLPLVYSFGRAVTTPDVNFVGVDNWECGRLAARTLAARGYEQIAFLGGPKRATSTQERRGGFLEECSKHKHVSATVSYSKTYSYEGGRAEMLRLLQEKPAEAYFCGDDVVALGALSALQDKNIKVPETVGLLGLNDMEMAGWDNFSLTTIRQPITEIVNASIELMVAMLEQPDRLPEMRLFPCRLVERKTLRPTP